MKEEMYEFLNDLINEFSVEGTISHDTFNRAVNLRSNIIADDDFQTPEIFMSIDTADKDTYVYCLWMKVGETLAVVQTKKMRDENEFKKEVDNLAKYFNVEVNGK